VYATGDMHAAEPSGTEASTTPSRKKQLPAEPSTTKPLPTKPRPTKPSRKGRTPLWAIVSIALGLVLTLGAGGALAAERFFTARYSAALHQDNLIAPGARRGAGDASMSGPLNFLLVGSDARAKNPDMGARSDTIIIVHVPATLDRAYLISIPRDLRVNIPAMPALNFPGRLDKINASFQDGGQGTGGIQLLSATLTQLIGVRFDGAAVVNFGGFDKVVQELGGVRMCVDQTVTSIHTGRVFREGCHDFTPSETLDYLRQRETLKNGDFDRQRHQQQFLKAIFTKTFGNGFSQNPLKIDQVIREVGKSMTVDTNGVPLDQLIYALRNVHPDSLVGVRVPAVTETIGGTSYVLQTDAAASLYEAIFSDTLTDWTATHSTWVNSL
jgi:LCP family protein required for cell wall assembly